MFLLLAHLFGDVLRHALYGPSSKLGEKLVTCRLVGDGDGRAEILSHVGGHFPYRIRFRRTGNEYPVLSVTVQHGQFHGNDIAVIFDLQDFNAKPLALDTSLTGQQGIAGKHISSHTHGLQQPETHALSADNGLVAMHAGPYGIPRHLCPGTAHSRMEADISTGKQSRELYRIGKRLRKGRHDRRGHQPDGNGFRLPLP